MSFTASNNRIVLTNRSGAHVFDTDRKMPAIVGVLSGSVSFRGLYSEDNNVVLGYAGKNVNFVYPTLKITSTSSSQYINGGIPFSSPGSVLITAVWGPNGAFWASILSVVNEGGVVIMRKRGRIEIVDGISVQYRIYLGRFI